MLMQVFFDRVRGALYKSTELASGVVDDKMFAVLAHPDGLVIRSEQLAGTFMAKWSEIAKAVMEAPHGDGEGWTPLRQAEVAVNTVTGEPAAPHAAGADEVWGNNLYTVHVRRTPTLIHLSYHRHDRAPARDWRHAQRIKNEIVGPEYEAVEIYPSEARLIDTSNQYHLFVILDEFGGPAELGIGFHSGRQVLSPDELTTRADAVGAVQRPFDG